MQYPSYWTSVEIADLGIVSFFWGKQGILRSIICEDRLESLAFQRRYCASASYCPPDHPYDLGLVWLLLHGEVSQAQLSFAIEYGTDFQRQVWRVIAQIPFGQTMTYQQVAQHVGGKQFARAVGLACGRNPLALFIPCHRVVSTNGSLGGYAWGLKRKAWLLAHERGLHHGLTGGK